MCDLSCSIYICNLYILYCIYTSYIHRSALEGHFYSRDRRQTLYILCIYTIEYVCVLKYIYYRIRMDCIVYIYYLIHTYSIRYRLNNMFFSFLTRGNSAQPFCLCLTRDLPAPHLHLWFGIWDLGLVARTLGDAQQRRLP